MAEFVFADVYKTAGLSPGPEIISLREKPFEKLCAEMEINVELALVRLYFNLPLSGGTDWFGELFRETDPSFTMVENAREASVLAGCALKRAINNKSSTAVLAILCASAANLRVPEVLPELVEDARVAQIDIGIANRNIQPLSIDKVKFPNHSALSTDIAEIVATNAANQFGPILTKMDEKTNKLTQAAKSTREELRNLAKQVEFLREETAMLWWHLGGYSALLDSPLNSLDAGLMSVISGIELAGMTLTIEGPAASTALLARTVSANSKKKDGKASIEEVARAFPIDHLGNIIGLASAKGNADIAPVLGGLCLLEELKDLTAWKQIYKSRAANLDETVEFSFIDLAVQVFREQSLLYAIKE